MHFPNSMYYDMNNQPVIEYSKNTSNAFVIGSFVRYYVPLPNSFYFALQGQVNFSRANSTNDSSYGTQESINKTPSYSLGLSVNPVFIFFPTKKWGIEAGIGTLGYNFTKYLADVSATQTFSLNLGTFTFGIAYYRSKK